MHMHDGACVYLCVHVLVGVGVCVGVCVDRTLSCALGQQFV